MVVVLAAVGSVAPTTGDVAADGSDLNNFGPTLESHWLADTLPPVLRKGDNDKKRSVTCGQTSFANDSVVVNTSTYCYKTVRLCSSSRRCSASRLFCSAHPFRCLLSLTPPLPPPCLLSAAVLCHLQGCTQRRTGGLERMHHSVQRAVPALYGDRIRQAMLPLLSGVSLRTV
jgi:hypothetical protein